MLLAAGCIYYTPQRLLCGVPHGSVQGPLLFALYSPDVIHIAAKYEVCKANSNTLTTDSRAASDQSSATSRLLACAFDIDR